MKIWKCLAVSKMIAASTVADTCWDLPVYPGLGLAATTCTGNGLTANTETCKTTCVSGEINHTCGCAGGTCTWTNVASSCKASFQVKEFVVQWTTSTPTSAATYESTISPTLISIFTKWIEQNEAANKDKGQSHLNFFFQF